MMDNAAMQTNSEDTMVVMDEVFFTLTGAIKQLQIGRSSVLKEVNEHRLQCFRHPKCLLFSREALRAWIVARTTKTKR